MIGQKMLNAMMVALLYLLLLLPLLLSTLDARMSVLEMKAHCWQLLELNALNIAIVEKTSVKYSQQGKLKSNYLINFREGPGSMIVILVSCLMKKKDLVMKQRMLNVMNKPKPINSVKFFLSLFLKKMVGKFSQPASNGLKQIKNNRPHICICSPNFSL